ncbi:hypothetical protein BRADI_3g40731v3 [Brachypodium distachyon]|uniref:Uncharacterized protein n=1 Tax=Brachypodium distachyon TaxID=15368 RepID=A0A2K2D2F2_BRADI|nr:hypothetical protein BRADI_3g40731v3 [Brachypodium distachyon]
MLGGPRRSPSPSPCPSASFSSASTRQIPLLGMDAVSSPEIHGYGRCTVREMPRDPREGEIRGRKGRCPGTDGSSNRVLEPQQTPARCSGRPEMEKMMEKKKIGERKKKYRGGWLKKQIVLHVASFCQFCCQMH